jgi:hypothetical protein
MIIIMRINRFAAVINTPQILSYNETSPKRDTYNTIFFLKKPLTVYFLGLFGTKLINSV